MQRGLGPTKCPTCRQLASDYRSRDAGPQIQICPAGHSWDPLEEMLLETYTELCRVSQVATQIERQAEELRTRAAQLSYRVNLILRRKV